MKTLHAPIVALGLALSTAAFVVSPSRIAAATSPGIACGSADAMMAAHAAPKMPRATGNVDKDFASAMMAQTQAMMALAHVEMECGKSARGKAAAQAFLDEEKQRLETIKLILHTN